MTILTLILLGFIVSCLGSIAPSFLNLTVVKCSLEKGRKSAFYVIGGIVTILFFQTLIGAYLSNILMSNTEYIDILQKIGIAVLILLSFYFFILHLTSKKRKRTKNLPKSKAYAQGLGISILNFLAIPFYFTSISLLIEWHYFEYSFINSMYFALGSCLGSIVLYSIYAIMAKRIQDRLTFLATKMNLILGCLTGSMGFGNLLYLAY